MRPVCTDVAPRSGKGEPAATSRNWLAGMKLAGLLAMLAAPPAFSQEMPGGALTDPELFGQLSAFEQRAALVHQATFNTLDGFCNNQDFQCTDSMFTVLGSLGTLVATAEELGTGQTSESGLGLDLEGLGEVLRWTAPEELLAQGSTVKQFANSQASVLGSRVAAIRAVSRAALAYDLQHLLRTGYASSDGMAAGAPGYNGPRLSTFFDAAIGFGDKGDTTLSGGFENAFDFDGQEYSLGLDYRFSNSLVAGGIVGYTNRRLDFDPSESIADGHIDSRGFSLTGFAQWDQQRFYATGSLGYQKLDFDSLRRVVYASENPGVEGLNAATSGSTDSSTLLATMNLGIPYQRNAFGAELYLKADYQNTKIDAFTEQQVSVSSPSGSAIAYDVGGQRVKSLNSAVGVKLQRVLTPSYGVFIPYLRAEYHRELNGARRSIDTSLAVLTDDMVADIEAQLADVSTALLADVVDRSHFTVAAGVSAVLRGSSRISSSGRAGGGLQGYLQFSKVLQLRNYRESVIAGGLRYEF